ncbi:MAG: thioredoxin family protein [Ginsengibacter sp.]
MRLNKLISAIFLSLLTVTTIQAQDTPAPADQIISEAKAEAAKTKKNVFIMFHASWCGWCHKMDASMNNPSVKSFFDDNYVITHLTVDESKDKKNLENPGADAIRTKYHGDNSGIPFWFILDKKGTQLADSRLIDSNGQPGENVGCPAKPEEVEHFIKVIKKTSKLSENQLSIIRDLFLKKDS